MDPTGLQTHQVSRPVVHLGYGSEVPIGPPTGLTSSTQTHRQRYCSSCHSSNGLGPAALQGTGHQWYVPGPLAISSQEAAEVRGLSHDQTCQGPRPGAPHQGQDPGDPSEDCIGGGRPKTATLVYISSRARGMETSGFGTPFWGSQIHAFWPISADFGVDPQNGLIGPSPGFEHFPRSPDGLK